MQEKDKKDCLQAYSQNAISVAQMDHQLNRRLLVSFSGLLITYTAVSTYCCGMSFTTLILFSLGILLVIQFSLFYRSISSAVIKGDAVILKNVKNEHAVTHLQSIRTMNTKKLAGKHFTSVQYKLDGVQRKALLVSDAQESDSPQHTIRRLQKEIKKKKANL